MKAIFHPEAREEFIASVVYYEECVVGLGADFHKEVLLAVQNVLQHPDIVIQLCIVLFNYPVCLSAATPSRVKGK